MSFIANSEGREFQGISVLSPATEGLEDCQDIPSVRSACRPRISNSIYVSHLPVQEDLPQLSKVQDFGSLADFILQAFRSYTASQPGGHVTS